MSLKKISDYAEFEDETLFFGYYNDLSIVNIIDNNNNETNDKNKKIQTWRTYFKILNWFQILICNNKFLRKNKEFNECINIPSLILTDSEQSILINILKNITNDNIIIDDIPLYIYHLYQYFCFTKDEIDFDGFEGISFIYEFKHLLLLLLDNDYDNNKLDKNININGNLFKHIYFPINTIKVKKIFKSLSKYKDCNKVEHTL